MFFFVGSSIAAKRKFVNGLLMEENSTTVAEPVLYTYDDLERRETIQQPHHQAASQIDYFTGTDTIEIIENGDPVDYLVTTMQVFQQIDAAGNATTFTYVPQGQDGAGQVASITDAKLQKSYFAYDELGRQIRTWGETDYPQEYSYNIYGELATLTTWRAPEGTPDFIDFTGATWPDPTAGTGDTTTWTYDEATGLLTRKEYADGNGTDYTYDVANRLAVRTWARDLPGGTSGDRLDTTYSYSATTGELLTVDYEDPDTADITYTYDRLGRQATVADATGTRSFDYDTATLQLDTETLDATFYDGHELTRQYEDGTETNGLDGRDKGYTLYDGGQTSVSAATYGYDTTGRLKTVTDGTDTFTYAYETDSNLLASLTAPQHNVAYTYETNRDLMTVIDNRAGSTGVSPVSTYTYGHDELGRRNTRQQSGSAIATTNTDTFDYNTRSEVEGSTNSDTTNKGTAVWNPSYTYDQIGNRQSSTGFQPVSTYTTNAVNQYTALDSTSPIHDIDGNLTSDGGSWTYTWNNENRLSSATNGTVTIDFTYDYQGRLVKKDDGIDVSIYIYDGWNRIATFTPQVSSLSLQVSYLWGLDLSGSMQGAGGVGGLLKEGSNYCLYDANGNIMQKLDGTGTVVMNLDYDPFGNVIALKDANGIVDSNLEFVGEYGFSTKPLIDDLDWYYYGFRYYDPVTGRWPSRDPMEENGGLNLYGFVGNDPVQFVDFLGNSVFEGVGPCVWAYKGIKDTFKDLLVLDAQAWQRETTWKVTCELVPIADDLVDEDCCPKKTRSAEVHVHLTDPKHHGQGSLEDGGKAKNILDELLHLHTIYRLEQPKAVKKGKAFCNGLNKK